MHADRRSRAVEQKLRWDFDEPETADRELAGLDAQIRHLTQAKSKSALDERREALQLDRSRRPQRLP